MGSAVSLAPQLFLLVYPPGLSHANVGLLSLPAVTSPVQSASCHLAVCLLCLLHVTAPPTSLDQCFFFNSLVVGLPHSLIFWQFWLFFAFKLAVVLLLVV